MVRPHVLVRAAVVVVVVATAAGRHEPCSSACPPFPVDAVDFLVGCDRRAVPDAGTTTRPAAAAASSSYLVRNVAGGSACVAILVGAFVGSRRRGAPL
mmetsp:Transcript_17537/g.70455  ORF Transcript_17537/g.70455 Transcript_17537/m.70455 type:complete len:98 (-) Transcript_17537:120-413(-)